VRELAHVATDPAVAEILKELALNDPFWAVRIAALEVLGTSAETGNQDLMRRAALDVDSRVRRTALRLLGAVGDPGLMPFFKDRFSQDDSYLVQAEALRAIGRGGDRDHLSFLRGAMETPSHRDVIREAAEWAIEELSKSR
jgi:HEAT repeat protein